MSLVTIVATTKFVTIMTDERSLIGNTIENENVKKFILIRDGRLFVAVAGDYQYGRVFRKYFKL